MKKLDIIREASMSDVLRMRTQVIIQGKGEVLIQEWDEGCC